MNIPVGFAQVNLKYTGPAAPEGAQVTFGVDPVASDPVDVAELVLAAWIAHLKANVSANITLGSVLVKMGPNSSGNFHELPANEAGGVGGDCDPPNTAYLINKITNMGGRQGRGRIYQPGVFASNTSNGGFIDASTQLALQSDWSDFLDGLSSSSVPMVLLHSDTTVPTPVTGLVVQNKVATQRRRLR